MDVAIIGAGLAGLSLALALHARSVPCSIYELRFPSVKSTGALMLSPNALRVLESLGVYERIRSKGYNFSDIAFKDEAENTTDRYPLGDEHRYGYQALRIYRQILLDELRSTVHACGIPVTYGKKFSHVLSENSSQVSFEFTDGTSAVASLLVGTDGIHSTVRKYVSPSTSPLYSGVLAITCAVPRSALRFPPDKDYSILPVGIHGAMGTFVLAPQDIDGSEVLAGTQKKYPEQTREEWDRLFSAKDELLALLSANRSAWPSLVQSALDAVPSETLSIWPYYTVAKLPSWASSSNHSRVLVLGDAAHAIPPTAGQGASQAFEDAFSLALLLSHLSSSQQQPETPGLAAALRFWETYRQERIDRVVNLTLKLNNTRLPLAEREMLDKGMIWSSQSDMGELEWLYNHNIQEEMLAGLKKTQ
ncbi:MAG: hypothetical protein LQ338_004239 [Usnochroma carphineum]|nr:MAG: hypothetical protein LQ338_004239 [Usnochroma carphineum]